jgi:RNA-directed DNA polymerase
MTWKQIQRRYANEGTFQADGIALFHPGSISVTRYRYRGARIPTPWNVESPADLGDPRARRAGQHER